MAKKTTSKQAQGASLFAHLLRRTQSLYKKDIGSLRAAWQAALSTDNPKRTRLLDIYNDTLMDAHLTGCINQRRGFVLKNSPLIKDQDGQILDEQTAYFSGVWFKDFCQHALDSVFYGHSLVEFGDVIENNGSPTFTSVSLLPRKHVCPEFGTVIKEESDDANSGISYRESPYNEWVVEIGGSHDLGLLLKCAAQTISKKNMVAFWDAYGEIFGMPIRIARTQRGNEKERAKLMEMLDEMGSAFSAVFSNDTDVEIKETAKTDAYNVYLKRIEFANAEMSKVILGQTMTIDNGSSLSQSEVHLEVLQNIIESDTRMIEETINSVLLPFMQRHGFTFPDGCYFEFDKRYTPTPQETQQMITTLLQAGYMIDSSYFEERYNIPVIGSRESGFENRESRLGEFALRESGFGECPASRVGDAARCVSTRNNSVSGLATRESGEDDTLFFV